MTAKTRSKKPAQSSKSKAPPPRAATKTQKGARTPTKRAPPPGFCLVIEGFPDAATVEVVELELRDVMREKGIQTFPDALVAVLVERADQRRAHRELVELNALGTFVAVGRHTVDQEPDRASFVERFTGARRRVYQKLLAHLEQNPAESSQVAIIDQSTVSSLVEGDNEAAEAVKAACLAFQKNIARYVDGSVDDFHRQTVAQLRALPAV